MMFVRLRVVVEQLIHVICRLLDLVIALFHVTLAKTGIEVIMISDFEFINALLYEYVLEYGLVMQCTTHKVKHRASYIEHTA